MLGGGDSRRRHSGTEPGWHPPAAVGEGGLLERGKDGAGSSLHAVATGAEGTGLVGSGMHVFATGAEGMGLTGGKGVAKGEAVDRVNVGLKISSTSSSQ
jgi:hypothetical protein